MIFIVLISFVMIICCMVKAIKNLVKGNLKLFIKQGITMIFWWFALIGSALAATVAHTS